MVMEQFSVSDNSLTINDQRSHHGNSLMMVTLVTVNIGKIEMTELICIATDTVCIPCSWLLVTINFSMASYRKHFDITLLLPYIHS